MLVHTCRKIIFHLRRVAREFNQCLEWNAPFYLSPLLNFMTQFSQERQCQGSECWRLRGRITGVLGELSQRIWRLEWEERCHHPCKAGDCSSGGKKKNKTAGQCRAIEPGMAVICSQIQEGDWSEGSGGLTEGLFPLPFGKGIASVSRLDWCWPLALSAQYNSLSLPFQRGPDVLSRPLIYL